MKIGLRLFLSSVTFSLVIAVSYWLVAHEIVGTFLLGFMAFAMCVIAGYMIVAEREADLLGDDAGAAPNAESGAVVGTYTAHSVLPFWTALSLALVLVGIITVPAIALLGCACVLALGVFYIVQS